MGKGYEERRSARQKASAPGGQAAGALDPVHERGGEPPTRPGLFGRLGLPEAGHAVPVLPLTAFLEQFDALVALQNVALHAEGRRCAETVVLRHRRAERFTPPRHLPKRGGASTMPKPRRNSLFSGQRTSTCSPCGIFRHGSPFSDHAWDGAPGTPRRAEAGGDESRTLFELPPVPGSLTPPPPPAPPRSLSSHFPCNR